MISNTGICTIHIRIRWEHHGKNEKIFYGIIIFLLLIVPLAFAPIILTVFDYSK